MRFRNFSEKQNIRARVSFSFLNHFHVSFYFKIFYQMLTAEKLRANKLFLLKNDAEPQSVTETCFVSIFKLDFRIGN